MNVNLNFGLPNEVNSDHYVVVIFMAVVAIAAHAGKVFVENKINKHEKRTRKQKVASSHED